MLIYRRALEIEAAQAAVNRSDAQLDALRASFAHDMTAEPDRPSSIERGQTPGPFHHLIFEAAGSDLLAALYTSVMGAVRKAMHDRLRRQPRPAPLRPRSDMKAIEQRDITRAAHAMALHVDRDLVPDDDLNPLALPRGVSRC